MENNKYKIYFSDSKSSKYGKLFPIGLVLLWFVFGSVAWRIPVLDRGLDTFTPLFFIVFFILIFGVKKFGGGDLVVEGNSLSFVKRGQEVARFPLDHSLIIKNAGTVSNGKNSHTTKFQIEHPSAQPLVFHFDKMGEMLSFSSVVVEHGGKFLDKEGQPVEVSEMQKQFASDPWGVLFNKAKREKFGATVQNYQNQKGEESKDIDHQTSPVQPIASNAQTYRPQVSANPEAMNQLKDKAFGIVRVVAIIIVVVVGYMVLRRYF